MNKCRPKLSLLESSQQLELEHAREVQAALVAALKNARDNLGRECDPQQTIMQVDEALMLADSQAKTRKKRRSVLNDQAARIEAVAEKDKMALEIAGLLLENAVLKRECQGRFDEFVEMSDKLEMYFQSPRWTCDQQDHRSDRRLCRAPEP